MISVIENNVNEEVVENPFPGMTLAEACAQIELFTEQALNECQMNILLAEHAYLYENHVEMEYVDEAGSLNEKGEALIQGLKDTISMIAAKVAEGFDKLIEWAVDYIAKGVEAFKKANISEKMAKSALPVFNTIYPKGCEATIPVVYFGKFKNEYKTLYQRSTKEELTGEVYKKYVDGTKTINIDYHLFDIAIGNVFTPKNIVNDIKAAKKEANNTLNDLKKHLNSAKKSDDVNELIKNANAVIRNNSRVARESIRVYHAFVSQQIAIVRAVLMGAPMKAYMNDELKKNVAKKVDEAKKNAKDAVDNAKEKANTTVAGAKEKVEGVVDNVKGKVDNAVDAGKEKVSKFNGKFFKTKK